MLQWQLQTLASLRACLKAGFMEPIANSEMCVGWPLRGPYYLHMYLAKACMPLVASIALSSAAKTADWLGVLV